MTRIVSVLDEAHGDEVLDIEESDGLAIGVDDGELIAAELADGSDRVGDAGGVGEEAGVVGHDAVDGLIELAGVAEDEAAEVGIGEDAGELAGAGIDEDEGAGAASDFGGSGEGVAHGGVVSEEGHVLAGDEAEDFGDGAEEIAERAAGVAAGEIGFGEVEAARGGEGEGIAEGERGGGRAGGGDEVGAAGLAGDAEGERDGCEALEAGAGIGRRGRDGRAPVFLRS